MNKRRHSQTVLVTGGAGFIGEAVCRGLLALGANVTATWFATPSPLRHPRLSWTRVDLTVKNALSAVGRFDAVVHLAARVPGPHDSAESSLVNHAIDSCVLAFVQERPTKLVYASSMGVYGPRYDNLDARVAEESGLAPDSPYAEEKVWAEHQGLALAGDPLAGFTALRISAPFGPGQRTRTVLSIFLAAAWEGSALRYHGSGEREQDFIYVDDVSRACVMAITGPSGVFNIASGRQVSMRSLALLVASIAGLDPALVQPSGVADPQEGRTARVSVKAAATQLDWHAEVGLSEGVSRTMDAYRRSGGSSNRRHRSGRYLG